MDLLLAATVLGGGFLLLALLVLLVAWRYRRVEQGQALIVRAPWGTPRVSFNGALVWPLLHRAEVVDLSLAVVRVELRGSRSILCQDGLRADIKVAFYVRVARSREGVLEVARTLGSARAHDEETLRQLFEARFAEAVVTVGREFALEEIYPRREAFKAALIRAVGKELHGFVVDSCAIDHLEKTPFEDYAEA